MNDDLGGGCSQAQRNPAQQDQQALFDPHATLPGTAGIGNDMCRNCYRTSSRQKGRDPFSKSDEPYLLESPSAPAGRNLLPALFFPGNRNPPLCHPGHITCLAASEGRNEQVATELSSRPERGEVERSAIYSIDNESVRNSAKAAPLGNRRLHFIRRSTLHPTRAHAGDVIRICRARLHAAVHVGRFCIDRRVEALERSTPAGRPIAVVPGNRHG